MADVLEIDRLTAGYGPLRVLHDISFRVAEGERVGLVGLNGHGKTTLFRAVSSLVGWQSGSIRLLGKEIGGNRSTGPGRRTPGIVRAGLAMAPQGDAIFPGLTVAQHLDCGAYTPQAWRERKRRREMVFDIFPPLRKLEHALVGRLSGGERRMVSVGRALRVEARLYPDRRTLARPGAQDQRGGDRGPVFPAPGWQGHRRGGTERGTSVGPRGPDGGHARGPPARQRRPCEPALMDLSVTLVNGLSLSAIYGLMAIRISLLWSSIGMINMAHGASFAVAGYAAWAAAEAMILAAFGKTALGTAAMAGVTLSAGALAGAAMGALIYLLAFMPIHDKPNFAVRSLIVTLAINLATVQVLLWWFGPRQKNLPRIFGSGKVEFLGASARYGQIGTILGTALILGTVLWWLRVSRKGLEIRAMMQNPEGAVLSGISVRWTALPVCMLTGALAGLAAVLLSQTIFVSPTSGAVPLIKGLIIALLGGLGSVPGAVAGAVIIGFLEAVIGAIPFLGQRYVLFGTFVFIIVVLIIRPRGLGGLLDEARK